MDGLPAYSGPIAKQMVQYFANKHAQNLIFA